jgi:hypothetical protein
MGFRDFVIEIVKIHPNTAGGILQGLLPHLGEEDSFRTSVSLLFAVEILRRVPDCMEVWLPMVLTTSEPVWLTYPGIEGIRQFLSELDVIPDWLIAFFLPVCAKSRRSYRMDIWAREVLRKANDDEIDRAIEKLL